MVEAGGRGLTRLWKLRCRRLLRRRLGRRRLLRAWSCSQCFKKEHVSLLSFACTSKLNACLLVLQQPNHKRHLRLSSRNSKESSKELDTVSMCVEYNREADDGDERVGNDKWCAEADFIRPLMRGLALVGDDMVLYIRARTQDVASASMTAQT